MAHIHREPYVTLAGLTEESALIAWGAFYFEVEGQELDGRFNIIEDDNLRNVNPPRQTSIGESSDFYGSAKVRVREKNDPLGQVIEREVRPGPRNTGVNHVWITGLKPNTEYEYQVIVNDRPWADEERRDWVIMTDSRGRTRRGMFLNGRHYENEFKTYPRAGDTTPEFAFAVIGDYGQGVKDPSTSEKKQREIAEALEKAVRTKGVRFVITTGDNIYGHWGFFGTGDSGDEDSDWFFTHYQPYRYILNRIPFYPSCGNHDSDETEESDDYDELLDNFYIRERFLSGDRDEGDAIKDNGLFYRFKFGKEVEFIAIDSAKQKPGSSEPRAFEKGVNRPFLNNAFPDVQGTPAIWRIPFFHHPPYVDGPQKKNDEAVISQLVPLFERSGVRIVFNGHEHNLQVSHKNGIYYVLSGSGGDLRDGRLRGESQAHNIAWAPKHQFLLVEYKDSKMNITPYGELNGGELQPLTGVKDPAGHDFRLPITASLAL